MPEPKAPVKPAKGDQVTAEWGTTYTVVRSTKDLTVTVSNPTEADSKATFRIPWCRVAGWKRAAQLAAEAEAAPLDLDAAAGQPAGG